MLVISRFRLLSFTEHRMPLKISPNFSMSEWYWSVASHESQVTPYYRSCTFQMQYKVTVMTHKVVQLWALGITSQQFLLILSESLGRTSNRTAPLGEGPAAGIFHYSSSLLEKGKKPPSSSWFSKSKWWHSCFRSSRINCTRGILFNKFNILLSTKT